MVRRSSGEGDGSSTDGEFWQLDCFYQPISSQRIHLMKLALPKRPFLPTTPVELKAMRVVLRVVGSVIFICTLTKAKLAGEMRLRHISSLSDKHQS